MNFMQFYREITSEHDAIISKGEPVAGHHATSRTQSVCPCKTWLKSNLLWTFSDIFMFFVKKVTVVVFPNLQCRVGTRGNQALERFVLVRDFFLKEKNGKYLQFIKKNTIASSFSITGPHTIELTPSSCARNFCTLSQVSSPFSKNCRFY